MFRYMGMVFGALLTVSLMGCAQHASIEDVGQQASAEDANEESAQEKTADDYVSEGNFSTDCPVSGATAGAIWFDNGYPVRTMEGPLVDSDSLVVEAGVSVNLDSPYAEWGIGFCVALLDENENYLFSYGDWKNGPTGSREMSIVCSDFSSFVEKYGMPHRYELYVVRFYAGKDNWWGFSDSGQLFVTSAEPVGYEAVKKAGKYIGDGLVSRSGDESGRIEGVSSSGTSSTDIYAQNDNGNAVSSDSAATDEPRLELYRAVDDVVYTLSVGASEWSIGSQVMSGNDSGGILLRGTVDNDLLFAETGAVYQMDSSAGGLRVVCVDKADDTVAFMEGDYSEDKKMVEETALSHAQ